MAIIKVQCLLGHGETISSLCRFCVRVITKWPKTPQDSGRLVVHSRYGCSPTVVMRQGQPCKDRCFVTSDFTGKRGRYFRLMILAVANTDNICIIKSPFAAGATLITPRHCHKLLIDQDIDFSYLNKILFFVATSI